VHHTITIHGHPYTIDPVTGDNWPAGEEPLVGRNGAFAKRGRIHRRGGLVGRVPYTYVGLHTSVHCNLACRYCQVAGYRRGADPAVMDDQARSRALRWAVLEFGAGARRVVLGYDLSGEPLLSWERFLGLADEAKRLAVEAGKPVTWGLNTNGMGLTDGIIEELERRPEINLAVSIDGPAEAQDAMRRTAGGRATYERAADAARRALDSEAPHLKQTHAVATLTGAYPHPDRVLEHLVELGFERIAISPVRGAGDGWGIDAESLPLLYKGYTRLADRLADDLLHGDGHLYDSLLPTDGFKTVLARVAGLVRSPLPCPAAGTQCAIGPDGSIYACDATVGWPQARIGTIDEGLDGERRRSIAQRLVDHHPHCRSCWARKLCGGECAHVALLSANDIAAVDQARCELRRHVTCEAIHFYHVVRSARPELVTRMVESLGRAVTSEGTVQ
jgi:uncharacterized protein